MKSRWNRSVAGVGLIAAFLPLVVAAQTPTPTPIPMCGVFSNSAPITIPGNTVASPYPSNITASGLGGVITKVTVALNGITHTSPSDIDVLLVGPSGQNAVIMSDVGSWASDVNLVLDDAAAYPLPRPGGSHLVSGTFQPTNRWECGGGGPAIGDTFPAPAPATPGGSPLGTFIGTNPNGTWSLYVVDDGSGGGSFSGGWAITVLTDACLGPTATPIPTPTPGGATHLSVLISGLVYAGIPFPIGVVAQDDFNNTVTTYQGTVHFTNSDWTGGQVPPDSMLTNGSGTFNATFLDIFHNSSISATDTRNSSITGTSSCVSIGKTATPTPSPTPLVPTPTPTSTPPPTPTPPILTPTPTATATPSPTPLTHPLNLSTRLQVGTGNNVGIGGFIINGTDPRQVLLRGIGPSLGNFGIVNPLADPVLELHGTGGFSTVTNQNWRDTQENEIMATGLAPTNYLESAILVTLDPGAYTAILHGNNDGVGVGLVEVYDLSAGGNSTLGNISTRGIVDTGSDIMIAGFILGGGSTDDVVLVRGIGPSLAQSGITNVLANPILELRDGDGAVVAMNDDWGNSPPVSLSPTDPLESAIEAALSPGAYTALLSGANNGTGVALVEFYDLGRAPSTPSPPPSPTPYGKIVFSRLPISFLPPMSTPSPTPFEETFALCAMDSNGAGAGLLTSPFNHSHATQPKWSFDGTKIVYVESSLFPPFPFQIAVLKYGSDSADTLIAEGIDPTRSPDGQKIAFGGGTITVMNADGSDLIPITTGYHPSWSPDGRKIAFSRDDAIWVMNPDGSDQVSITNNQTDFSPEWSPDGTRIAFVSTRDGNWEIYAMDATGANQIRLTDDAAEDESPSWSPDGSRIVFESWRDGHPQIYVMNADGSNQTRISNNMFPDRHPSWQWNFETRPPAQAPASIEE